MLVVGQGLIYVAALLFSALSLAAAIAYRK
ncbi:exported hypothetical protein [Burkholderiales bacterium]|nr:exported hypothetical protein [Burkholderiales bacterium]